MKLPGLFPWLLLFYVAVVLVFGQETLQGDEGAYLQLADNLTRGFFSPTDPGRVSLWYGPGYPLFLLPFRMLGLPLIVMRLANALLLAGAMALFYRALSLVVQEETARCHTWILGLYPLFLPTLPLILSESLTVFLICAFLYIFLRCHRDPRPARWILSGALCAAALACTKVFFGYVLAACLLASLIPLLLRRDAFRRTAAVFALALIFCLPYLATTYSLTGKIFYWGASGGESLYWMSTPFAGEWGDWLAPPPVTMHAEVATNHGAFWDTLKDLAPIEKDSALKARAVEQIGSYPGKFFVNWIANISRMLFSFPFSYTPQKLTTLFTVLPNMVLLTLGLFSVRTSVRTWSQTPFAARFLLFFAGVAFLGSSLLSAYSRQFTVLVPIFWFWISCIMGRRVEEPE